MSPLVDINGFRPARSGEERGPRSWILSRGRGSSEAEEGAPGVKMLLKVLEKHIRQAESHLSLVQQEGHFQACLHPPGD